VSATPAGELARLKVQHPEWRIDRRPATFQQGNSAPGWGTPETWSATRRADGVTVTAGSAGELEGIITGLSPSKTGPKSGRREET
jgi:hypothetical protein